jgi:hypothetical protein
VIKNTPVVVRFVQALKPGTEPFTASAPLAAILRPAARRLSARAALVGAVSLACACNVESTTKDTGGLGGDAAQAGAGNGPSGSGGEGGRSGDETPEATCPAGLTVVLSDYVSTQIALSALDGTTLSASFLSTGSTETDGLAFALSGDVVVPSSRPSSGRVVLLDRFGTNVITWADPSSARVLGQLAVGTGFESNPSDYLEVDAHSAFVTRWGQNANPGQEDNDRGGDVLVVDTESFTILGSIELPFRDSLPPRPSGMTRRGDHVYIPLERVSDDYSTTGEASLAVLSISAQSVDREITLSGLKACGRPALSPDGQHFAVACTGALDMDGNSEDISESAVVLFDATQYPPVETDRWAAKDLIGEPLQNDVVFASNDVVLLKTQTAFAGDSNSRWLAAHLDSRAVDVLLEARPDDEGAGKGLVYGAMVCAPGCSSTCLLADSDRRVLERVSIDDSQNVTLIDPVTVETDVGLPPTDIGFR